ncbi:MAG: glycosyltransferase [Pseudomonadota bacterium]
MKQLIFQLGTNNWQRGDEFAPGSGILHECHHKALNELPETVAYSVYPSQTQTSNDPLVSILQLPHEIPICESVSPVSSYRFHSMTEKEFDDFRALVGRFAAAEIARAEEAAGVAVTTAIAHHSFLNPLVLLDINRARAAAGLQTFQILCYVHGTALKMFAHEKRGVDPEYPPRFLPLMQEEGVFDPERGVDACAAISAEQLDKIADVFPEFPRERMILSLNGYNQDVFKHKRYTSVERNRILRSLKLAPSCVDPLPGRIDSDPDAVVVFCGKFADWKRLDAVLEAAKRYEESHNYATLIIGSGPQDAIDHYHRMAYETLKLRNTWFLGPQPQSEIARINALADVGVYPSRNEPFGLVLVECMATGTPVIGMNSGGPRDFVSDDVGVLLPEAEGAELSESLSEAIRQSISESWKSSKGETAAAFAKERFSVSSQVSELMQDFDAITRKRTEVRRAS